MKNMKRRNTIVFAAVLAGLTAAAGYSYIQLDFGRKIGMFFSVGLPGGGDSGGRMPGRSDSLQARQRPGGGAQVPGGVDSAASARRARLRTPGTEGGPQPGPGVGAQGSQGTNSPGGRSLEVRGLGGRFPEGERRAGLGGGRGASVSLGNVFGYTVILAFVAMLSALADRGVSRARRLA
jgi:hypothetical protein